MCFSLRRLPALAFIEILKSMEPIEVIFLSQTSQKTRGLMTRRIKFGIYLQIPDYTSLVIRFCASKAVGITIKIGDMSSNEFLKCPVWKFGENAKLLSHVDFGDLSIVKTYWQEKLNGFEAVIDYLTDMFDVKPCSIYSLERDSRKPLQILEHVLTRGLTFKFIEWHVHPKEFNVAIAEKVLGVAAQTSKFILFTNYGHESCKLKFDRFHEYRLKSFLIYGAYWITSAHLCALINCSKILLTSTHLTNQDFHEFLKHWKSIEGQVTSWSIDNKNNIDAEIVLKGLDCEKKSDFKWRILKSNGITFMVSIKGKNFWLGTDY